MRIPGEVKEDGKAQTREEEWLPETLRVEVRKLEELEGQLNEIFKPDPVQDTMEQRELHTHSLKILSKLVILRLAKNPDKNR